jgi:hypothetical protein
MDYPNPPILPLTRARVRVCSKFILALKLNSTSYRFKTYRSAGPLSLRYVVCLVYATTISNSLAVDREECISSAVPNYVGLKCQRSCWAPHSRHPCLPQGCYEIYCTPQHGGCGVEIRQSQVYLPGLSVPRCGTQSYGNSPGPPPQRQKSLRVHMVCYWMLPSPDVGLQTFSTPYVSYS